MAEESFLGKLKGKLSEAIEDLTSLEVRTYRGSLSHIVNQVNPKKIEDFLTAETVGELKLVRLTKSQLDGDTVLFIDDGSTDAGDVPELISDAHEEAVRSANEMRQGLAELAAGVVKSAF